MIALLTGLACTFGPYETTEVLMTTPVLVETERTISHHFEYKRLGGGSSGFVHTCEEDLSLYIRGEFEEHFHGESLETAWTIGACPNLTYNIALSPKAYFLGYVIEIENAKDIRRIPIPGHYHIGIKDPYLDTPPIPMDFSNVVIDFSNLGNLPTEVEWISRENAYEDYLRKNAALDVDD